jgi:hypothetical protein
MLQTREAPRSSRTTVCQLNRSAYVASVAASFFVSGLRSISGVKVSREAMAHPSTERGISRARMMSEYFFTPGLTTPAKNWTTRGRKWAKIFETHRLSQTGHNQQAMRNLFLIDLPISIHVKNQTILTCPIYALGKTVAPRMIGTAIIRAIGET